MDDRSAVRGPGEADLPPSLKLRRTFGGGRAGLWTRPSTEEISELRGATWTSRAGLEARPTKGRSVDFGFGDGGGAVEEVEVATLLGLGDSLGVEGSVAARNAGRGLDPVGFATGQFGFFHQ